MEAKRELSEAELRRKKQLEEDMVVLEEQGYTPRNLTVGIVKANVMAIVIMLPFIVLDSLIFFGFVQDKGNISYFDSWLCLIFLIVLTVVHELIHGITWGLFTRKHGKDIEFGVVWKAMTPYCTCSSALTKTQYIWGSLMPTLVIGIIGTWIAIVTKQYWIYITTVIMILGGGGDFYITLKLLQDHPKKDVLYRDHPYEVGLIVFEK